ncbi:hypothetical protein OPQ81_007348 [Rhizoctonia solani]|nr:hypothetical protein OPQ81_007348 [Rhizoctonia solani]
MEDALCTFHNHKDVFQELGAVSTDKGFHGIPKIHMISHYMHLIWELGTPNGYNTKTSEQLHIDFAKLGYRASNKVNATKQMALYIQQVEVIEMHGTYLSELEKTRHSGDPGSGPEPSRPEVEMLSEHNEDYVYEEEDEWDAWFEDEDEDEGEESSEELTEAGVRVKPMVTLEVGTHVEGKPWEKRIQPPGAKGGDVSLMFYPNPQHVVAKTPTVTATVSELMLEHGAEHFLDAINSFVSKELLNNQQMLFDNNTRLNIWSQARLFHAPPPFQPSEGCHVEVICTQPAKVDQYCWVSRPRQFNTVLLLAFLERMGIHHMFNFLSASVCSLD